MRAAAMTTRRKARRTPIPAMTMPRTIMAIMTTAITIITTSIAITSIATAIPMLMTTSNPPVVDDLGEMGQGEAAALYRLMTWLSPAFPVGAFSYSSGIEWAVEAGDIHDAASLRDWLAAMLADGPGFCDGVFLAAAHRAATALKEHDQIVRAIDKRDEDAAEAAARAHVRAALQERIKSFMPA